MFKYILRRCLVAIVRISGLTVGILLLIELSFCVLGGSDKHVWLANSFPDEPFVESMEGAAIGAESSLTTKITNSTSALLIGYFLVLFIGFGWGILGARFRRFRLPPILAFFFSTLACAPGFWLIIILVQHSVFSWSRPGYADELLAQGAGGILHLWHLVVLGILIAAGWISWQILTVSELIQKEASAPYVRYLYIRGYRDDSIFYGNVFRRTVSSLTRLIDKPVAPMLGALIALEWAFHFDGIGSYLVKSARAGHYGGILFVGFWMGAMVVGVKLIREILVRWVDLMIRNA